MKLRTCIAQFHKEAMRRGTKRCGGHRLPQVRLLRFQIYRRVHVVNGNTHEAGLADEITRRSSFCIFLNAVRDKMPHGALNVVLRDRRARR